MRRRLALSGLALALTGSPVFGAEPCYTQDKSASSEPAATIFARAKKEYDAKRFDEAAPRFRDVALNHSKDPNAAEAASLYLESINAIANGTRTSRSNRDVCFDDIVDDVPLLRARLCTSDDTPADKQRVEGNKKACRGLNAVQFDIERLAAQKLVEQADAATVAEIAVPLYRRGASQYFDSFRQFCQEPGNRLEPVPRGCDEVAFNAGRAYRGAHDIPKAITAFRALLAHDEQMKARSPLAARATREVGELFRSIASFDVAAEWYERFSRQFPREPEADRALSDAISLRLATGDLENATQDVRQFIAVFGPKSPTQLGQVILALASFHAEKKDWNATRASLVTNIRFFEKTPPDLRIRAHTLLARAGVNSALEFARVRSELSPDLLQRLTNAWAASEDEAQIMRRYASTLTAIGEAYFFAAEQARAATVSAVRVPAYSGAMNDSGAINAYVDTKLKEWYLERSKAIEDAEKGYLKILDLPPSPPPKWVVLAAARVAFMWADFADVMSSDAQVTTFIAAIQPPSLRSDVRRSIQTMREHLKVRKAKPALLKCRDLSAKYQITVDDDPRGPAACEAWLSKNFKDEHYGLTEIIPELYDTPTLLPQDPVRRDGSIVAPMRP